MAPLRDFAHIAGAYGLSLGVGAAAAWMAPVPSGLWTLFVFDTVATVVMFAIATAYRNSSFYDAYWSVLPPILGAAMWAWGDSGVPPRQVLVMSLVCLWTNRLT